MQPPTEPDADKVLVCTDRPATPNCPRRKGRDLIFEAMTLPESPRNGGHGSGAIGMEFAYFYNAFGTEVHVVEMQTTSPIEDQDISAPRKL